MIYLYVKTHNMTGLKYLGQTTNANPYQYKGSGLYWRLHLAKHGNDCTTEILCKCQTKEELRYWGEYFSELYDIVKSEQWANLKPEIGDGGSPKGINKGRKHSSKTKAKISAAKKGKSINRTAAVSTETKKKISNTLTGRVRSSISILKQRKTRKAHGPYNHSAASIKKMQKPKSDRHKENMRLNHTRPCKDGKWINNGIESKIWHFDTPPENWKFGRSIDPIPPSQKGKKWMTNGEINKMTNVLLDGWKWGRTKLNK